MKEYHKAIETYKKGLTIEPSNAACKQGLQRVQTAIYNEGGDKGRAEQAMKEPLGKIMDLEDQLKQANMRIAELEGKLQTRKGYEEHFTPSALWWLRSKSEEENRAGRHDEL